MTAPALSFLIAPGSNRTDLNPGWSEIGTLLRGFSVKRGKQYETDQPQAGTATIVCKNDTRALDPSYTLGPYYPYLLPGMQVYLRATQGGVTYGLFRGNVERITAKADGPNYVETTFECSDRLTDFANPAFTVTGTFVDQKTGARILAVLALANVPLYVAGTGWPLGTGQLGTSTRLAPTLSLNAIDAGVATVGAETVTSVSPLQYLTEIAQSEPGRFFISGDGAFVFRDRSRYAPSSASVLTVTDNPAEIDATHPAYQEYQPSIDIDRVKNDIKLTVIGGTTVERIDAPSADTYGPRALALTTHLRAADSDVQNQLGWWIYSLKDARQRVQQIALKGYDTNSYANLLPRELGDHITVRRTPPGSPSQTLVQEEAIEGLQIDGTRDGVWTWKLWLSPIAALGGWVLGTDHLNSGTRLAFK